MMIETNADDAGLAPTGGERPCIGHVDAVNGRGAPELPSFRPTRAELLELARYWVAARRRRDHARRLRAKRPRPDRLRPKPTKAGGSR